MSTHDMIIDNAVGATVRADINSALAAIVSQNSSATEPATMYAYMSWFDTTTNILKMRNAANSAWIGYPVAGITTVASDTTIDIFGAAGATIDLTGTTTVTGLTACTAAQVGSKKTIIPSNAAGVSFTASANLIVDGATSGTYLMPLDAIVEVLATSTTTFKVRTVFAKMAWTPEYELTTPGTSSFGTYTTQNGLSIKIGNKVVAQCIVIGGTFSVGTGSGDLYVKNLPWQCSSAISGTAVLNNASAYVTLFPTHGRVAQSSSRVQMRQSSGGAYANIQAANCGNSLRTEFSAEYLVS